ncbi:MAG: hypothetical protein A3C93_00320 [Candidatus Lloydbacteria bacterium RIFCSPHIGHO2_02_FULL_54_17]|uniref:Uncharacterized protein n=1 Tax=Candidatus Lloydbacteria bacterium RIFCSPHIGHO2_02_FULL_54_17 TaxID=1798664 RepID=A0A1G2DE67_9BACT|nr:MAG: hypothetical protein A2762_01980 [Candidatus Lloydbacteria bacterium RIFCSPHIGHO2_01_FULL_54_11]OGZ11833.1 MAG: hypothetical protein A3C93_00320 [Candidatus Lloydbacteria bacterium RIFCSPHIGHO2_02_FULL_54_17]OGZ14145.1 MAG: hypothetical protein A2948_03465 [Candidatus Lloydbacteria bacterium RIFCSPLOWO2_01_FULL_54_18]OGZ16679.1 MAG: hypothetical protein A3H76_00025 [Candidatus Lloydbacteria bacterium RIFCSPLOWO2_02_FULL_54_12]
MKAFLQKFGAVRIVLVGLVVALLVVWPELIFWGAGQLLIPVVLWVIYRKVKTTQSGSPMVRILKAIGAVLVVGVLGTGFFCGGLLVAFGANSFFWAVLVWVVGVVVIGLTLRGMFSKKNSQVEVTASSSFQTPAISQGVPRPKISPELVPLWDYIKQARATEYPDQAIKDALLSAGWRNADIDDALGWSASSIPAGTNP